MSVRFVPRARLWAQSPFFAATVFSLQRVVYDETPGLWEGPDDTEAPAGFCGARVLRVAQAPTRTDRYAARLARGLSQLMTTLAWPELQLVGLHRRSAWDGKTADGARVHPPLQRARERLQAAGLPRGFKGALAFAPPDCALVVPAWFWAERCGAAPSGLRLGVAGQRLTGALCVHGNLHLELYDPALMRRLDDALPACGLAPVEGPCHDRFGRGPAIAGRRLLA